MYETTGEPYQDLDWNVLTGSWLEIMTLGSEPRTISPLEALNEANTIRCIAVASPLDLFAAHRFLLTLLYWKADAGGGVSQVRDSLLNGTAPRSVLDAIAGDAPNFSLFDQETPFLQDPSKRDTKESARKSPGSLFAEMATGTNVAHFHHGDDKKTRLCLRCATIGMLRLVPWTQSGGQGLSPSIHNAPPIMALASGENLATTLGLNLVPLEGTAGEAKWSGHFEPSATDKTVPYMEALTWNPRRVLLPLPESVGSCWRCGQAEVATVGPIVYLKNERTIGKGVPFSWHDPSAFYNPGSPFPFTTRKSRRETWAASNLDLKFLGDVDNPYKSAVVETNENHIGWSIIIPCTNPAHNNTFDHRQVSLTSFTTDAISAELPDTRPVRVSQGLDGWQEPMRTRPSQGAVLFVTSAARLLTYGDWVVLSEAAYSGIQESPAAFDLLTGLLWPLRGMVAGLPSRNVAWLVLKLMASVPAHVRITRADASFNPFSSLAKRQPNERGTKGSVPSIYPVSLPSGLQLEAELRRALEENMRRHEPNQVHWAGLCNGLDQLLD